VAESLEQRLQRLEDRDAIHQLFSDYGHYLDRGDVESYSQLFSEDAEVLLGPMRAKGRDNIREMMRGVLERSAGTSLHIISSPKVELHGDTATSEVMWTVVGLDANGATQVTMVGRHLDDLVRVDGRWLLAKRRGVVDLPQLVKR
jgi:uncharacterized protein (TIGR02246 family)